MATDGHAPAGSVAWYYRPFWIGVLALFVLGPLALPLVRRSPALAPRAKTVAIALIIAYTVFLVWETWVAVELVLGRLQP